MLVKWGIRLPYQFLSYNTSLQSENQAKVAYFTKLMILIFGCPEEIRITNFTRMPQQQWDRLIPIKSVRATFQRNHPSPILNKQAKLKICYTNCFILRSLVVALSYKLLGNLVCCSFSLITSKYMLNMKYHYISQWCACFLLHHSGSSVYYSFSFCLKL